MHDGKKKKKNQSSPHLKWLENINQRIYVVICEKAIIEVTLFVNLEKVADLWSSWAELMHI